MKRFFLLALVLGVGVSASAQPHGIDERLPNTELVIADLPPSEPGQMQAVRAFPNLQFAQAVLMIECPDDSGRLFVVSQAGRIYAFDGTNPNTTTKATFLDISGRVYNSGERGLLGLAFARDYATSGVFYVSYITYGGQGKSRLSRFVNANPAGNAVDGSEANEEVLLEIQQPYSNHNGGMIAFGPDGKLYWGLGDGGSAGDPGNRAQDTTNLFGSILRLDVTSTPAAGEKYVIPPDNPFHDGGPAGAATRKEIYAYGVRNPWRLSFDLLSGYLFAGDVGQDAYEEVDVIKPGLNYGWRIMEGYHCYNPSSGCNQAGLELPIAEYSHSMGNSITGGFVYYGSVPELYGQYIYADYVSHRVWALSYDGATATAPAQIATLGFNIAGFGQDASGEVYVLEYTPGETGGVYTLQPQSAGGSDTFPTKLSELPALLAAASGQGHTIDGVIPYEPSAKLWSDGAAKERYMAMPGLGQAGYRESGGWDFPEESILIKNFLLPMDRRDPDGSLRRIETRLLYRKNGAWHGFTYEWNDEQNDGVLLTSAKTKTFDIVDESGATAAQTWLYPSRAQCLECHTPAANHVLGITTPQMNSSFTYPRTGVTDNQLRALNYVSVFSEPLPAAPEELPAMPDSNDTSASIQDRTRAYLAANCSMCHRPAASSPSPIDLRWEIANGEMNLISALPSAGDLGINGAFLIAPGDPDRSILLQRIKRLDSSRMPPLASGVVDEEGVSLMTQWIESLQPSQAHIWYTY